MPHPRGKRSVDAKIRRITRHYILENAYRCPIWAETICRTNQTQIEDHVIVTLTVQEGLQIRRILRLDENETLVNSHVQRFIDTDMEKGLVLTDSRGRGAFQK